MANRFSGPLPGAARAKSAPQPVLGFWRAWVERAAPLAVSVPELFGSNRIIPNVEVVWEVTHVAPLTEGTPVWVTCIEGVTTSLLVTGRRG